MEYIQRIPFIVGALTALIVGIISYKTGLSNKDIYIRMTIAMLLFFMIGLYVRNTLISIREEMEKKKLEQEAAMAREQAEMKEQQLNMASETGNIHTIDYRVDDGDEFLPFEVSQAIKTKINE